MNFELSWHLAWIHHIELDPYHDLIKCPLPSEIGLLTKLTELSFNYDYGGSSALAGTIPFSLSMLTGLWTLDLGNNQLSGPIPSSLSNLSALGALLLGSNQLSGSVPSSLSNLLQLRLLDLSNNVLTGSIPESLSNLTQLNSFNLSNNWLDRVHSGVLFQRSPQ